MLFLKNLFLDFNQESLKKYIANTSWLLFISILKIIVFLFVGTYVARYLGPYNYGILNYCISFVLLFSAFSGLGLDFIVVRELVKEKDKNNEILGTACTLKILSTLLVLFAIWMTLILTNNSQEIKRYILLISFGLLFQTANIIDFYFQSQVLSKHTVLAQFLQLIIGSALKMYFIYTKAPLYWFVWTIFIEYVILAVGLIINYFLYGKRLQRWKFNFNLAVYFLRNSWPLIFSGMMIAIYTKIDKIMLKHMLGEATVGIYSAATNISEAGYFIPSVICGSIFPAIVKVKIQSQKLYFDRLKSLYSLMIWLSLVIIMFAYLWGEKIILFFFGNEYFGSILLLKIHIWSNLFVYIWLAIGYYLMAENYTGISLARASLGMLLSITLNYFLILRYNVLGSAFAAIISYFFVMVFIAFVPKTRAQIFLIMSGFDVTRLFRKYKK